IVDELGGEKIDIVRWNESSQILISNALKPAEIQEVALCFELGRATVVVSEDQLSLAIGKRGQNVRLGARLTGWDIDILTPEEYNKGLDDLEKTLKCVEGVEDVLLDKLLALGIISLMDVKEVGADPLIKELEFGEDLANRIVATAEEAVVRLAEEAERAKAAEEQKAAEELKAAEVSDGDGETAADDVPATDGTGGEEAGVASEEVAESATDSPAGAEAVSEEPAEEPMPETVEQAEEAIGAAPVNEESGQAEKASAE
ncbi:MAG: transcription termination factor NusA, partial [Phycisphaerae bacterium]